MDKDFILNILDDFSRQTGVKTKWISNKTGADHGIDGEIQFNLPDQKITIPTQVKTNLLPAHLPALFTYKKANGTLLVLIKEALPKVKDEMQGLGINYIDAAGNAYIKQNPLIIMIEGRKALPVKKDLKAKPFNKAGLKIIYLLLVREDYINKTIREIAKEAEVSLDSVHKTMNGLKELKYLILIDKQTLGWNNKKELLARWLTNYEMRLKPGLHIGNFEFVDDNDFLNWKKIDFKNTHTKWGGEPAGELLSGNLKPEILTIYTKESRLDCIKNYKLLPNPSGNLRIYQNFWTNDDSKNNTVSPMLVYADLVNTGNRRNLETAQKVYEQYLQNRF